METTNKTNTVIDLLKSELKDNEAIYVAFVNPNNKELFNNSVKWVIAENTKIGGVQLDYGFGVMTDGSETKVVSTTKVPESEGIRLMCIPNF